MPLPLLAIPALVQAGVGLFQTIKGNKRAKNLVRPERQVSQAVQEGVATTKYGAQAGRRPGSDVARENISGAQAGTVSQIQKAGGSSASAMAAALGAQEQANQSMQQQDILDAQFQQQMQMQYLNQLDRLAQEQAANWQWNEAQQFQEEADAARRQQESGMQNLFGGITEAAGLGFMNKMGYLGQGMGEGGGLLGGLFGGGKNKKNLAQAMSYLQQGPPQTNKINTPMSPYQYTPPDLRMPIPQIPKYGG